MLIQMSNQNSDTATDTKASPFFLRFLATIAILGGVALIAGNIVGSIVVTGHDWVADTVSDLAAGQHEIIQDIALYGYAGALSCLALAAAHLHGGGWRWTAFSMTLLTTAICVIVIGARNEYGDGDSEGIVVHIYVVYALGALFVATYALAAQIHAGSFKWFAWLSWGAAAVWVVGAPVFFMMSTAYDGAFERGLGIVSVIWSSGMAYVLLLIARKQEIMDET